MQKKTNQGLVIIGLALGMLTMVVSGGTSAGAADKAPAGQAAVEKGPRPSSKRNSEKSKSSFSRTGRPSTSRTLSNWRRRATTTERFFIASFRAL